VTNREPKDVLEFAAGLGVQLYDWQARILLALEHAATLKRKKFAVRAPNGVGKTQRIIALTVLRWLQRFPRGKAVVTSYDARQVSDQLWPSLRAQAGKFPFLKFSDAEHTITSREGGRIRAFTTDDPGRAEGFHADADCPLLIIVDEAKSVDPEVIKAIDRCSYNVLLYISSPGLKQGPFYDAFTANRESFITFAVGLTDCPHIAKEKIEDIIATYGADSPFTRSVLYGEFMNFGDGVTHILELSDVETWAESVIDFTHGPTVFGCDFAAGGDDNVIVKRAGNKLKEIMVWKDKDTANASGRFVRELRRMGYQEKRGMSVFGDATGIGRTMCDLIRESGIGINDFNFGGHSNDLAYKDEGTRVWYTVAKAIKSGRIACPDRHHDTVKKLLAQLTSRRQKAHSTGKLWMESKDEMRSRGVKSPDVADAFVIAFGVQPALSFQYSPLAGDDSGYTEIAQKHGWQYSGSEEEARKAMYGGSNRGDDDSGGGSSVSGFGGIHSDW
jgi:phage terminase large subunit